MEKLPTSQKESDASQYDKEQTALETLIERLYIDQDRTRQSNVPYTRVISTAKQMAQLDNENRSALLESNRKLREALEESQLQLEYYRDKFQETGTGNAVLAMIGRTLKELE